MTTCEKITWLLSEGEKWLKPEYRYGLPQKFDHILFLEKSQQFLWFPYFIFQDECLSQDIDVDVSNFSISQRSCGRSMIHKRAKVEFYPLGVIGAIVSWNYPFHNIFNPMLAAVFSGNSIVIKVPYHLCQVITGFDPFGCVLSFMCCDILVHLVDVT